MTGQELENLFYECVDDENIDNDTLYIFLNQGKETIERMREWEMLKSTDESNSTTGDYTHSYDCPSDFLMPLQMDTIFINDTKEYQPIRPEKWSLFKETGGYVKFDLINDKFYLGGEPQSGLTITQNYIKSSDDIVSGSEVDWPTTKTKNYQPAIAYKAAQLWYDSQGIQPNFDKGVNWLRNMRALLETMKDWDNSLKVAYQNNYNGNY